MYIEHRLRRDSRKRYSSSTKAGRDADMLPTHGSNENLCRKCIFYATILNSYSAGGYN